MRKQIVAANWKMNGSSELVRQLVPAVRDSVASLDNAVEVVIMPPSLFASEAKGELAGSPVMLGVQNVARWQSGAYTGELSAAMAADIGCHYALVGHSERRQLFGETDDIAAEKVLRVLESGLAVMLCVGETLEEREAGDAEAVVCRQVEIALSGLDSAAADRVVVAYEPVWAIGTGRTATAEDAQAMHRTLRDRLSDMGLPANEMSLLYGGSVKPDNAGALFAQPDIDGGLIGGASLKADDFIAICQAAVA
ncbi:triose-phosphate isomerase [Marinobacter zhanjiangensis]|uniref:Triosephosphate isomerase n=1 Tax=Marinobacter zhanjiangensis TaxID=578215 RepID=A0ABQ3B8G4_9GAMM|nr:triose-phosphate isomerase [Marinobacter zhanjiangensis]GGY80365.1 triosephosphate isomerase [Marinobacter zhanjiangensis]